MLFPDPYFSWDKTLLHALLTQHILQVVLIFTLLNGERLILIMVPFYS